MPYRMVRLVFVLWGMLHEPVFAQEAPVIDEEPFAEIVLVGTLDSPVPEYVFVPFDVPAGTELISLQPRSSTPDNVLDFGVVSDDGALRGWSGSDGEEVLLGTETATPGYLPGPLPDRLSLAIGLARMVRFPAAYEATVRFFTTSQVSLRATPQPYRDVVLGTGARWVAGDLHVHTEDSADASPTQQEVAAFARSRGLDFVVLTDHNVTSHLGHISATQASSPDLLLVPGVEVTTYHGHMNGLGATQPVSHFLGMGDYEVGDIATEVSRQGALFSLNHPALDIGDALCMGCLFEGEIRNVAFDAIEIQTGRFSSVRAPFTLDALALWDVGCDEGHHIAAVGGSDDHRGGVGLAGHESPIGSPTTMVFVEELSRQGLIDGIRHSRTVVKLRGPEDPMIELRTSPERVGDTVSATEVTLTAIVTGGTGLRARWVRDGRPVNEEILIQGDPFRLTRVENPTGMGEVRWRVELWDGEEPRTITSHVWLRAEPDTHCSCGSRGGDTSGGPLATLSGAIVVGFIARRRRMRPR